MAAFDQIEITPLQHVADLDDGVRENVLALQSIQKKCRNIFQEYLAERENLAKKYDEKYQPLYSRRKEIVTGESEPTDKEVAEGQEFRGEDNEPKEEENKLVEIDDDGNKIEEEKTPDAEKGIPNFWLTALKNDMTVGSHIEPQDEDALSHLTNIHHERGDDSSFKLIFSFSENEYFTNETLTKQYFVKLDKTDGDVLLVKAQGDTINWKAGKNLTHKIVPKKQISKSGKGTRVVNKSVVTESFFHFFSPPQAADEDLTEEIAEGMEEDFDVGRNVKDLVIPRAISWYIGETGMNLDLENSDFDFDDLKENSEDDGPKQTCDQQ